jgi:hypothetical protein
MDRYEQYKRLMRGYLNLRTNMHKSSTSPEARRRGWASVRKMEELIRSYPEEIRMREWEERYGRKRDH